MEVDYCLSDVTEEEMEAFWLSSISKMLPHHRGMMIRYKKKLEQAENRARLECERKRVKDIRVIFKIRRKATYWSNKMTEIYQIYSGKEY